MSLDYSFKVWVPREQIFQALSVLIKYSVRDELASLIWPNDQNLLIKNTNDEMRDPIPVDGSLQEDFCVSFAFHEDEILRRYNGESMEHQQKNGGEVWDMRQPNRTIRVGCIWTKVELKASKLDWLDGETLLTEFSFTAATTSMSRLFSNSPSIHTFFVDLAREMGAVSCGIDCEGNGCQWLYIDGNEIRIESDFLSHPRWILHIIGGKQSDDEEKLRACIAWSFGKCSSHQKMELALLTQDANSGVRALALNVLSDADLLLSAPLIEAATNDCDWRVRANAAYLIGRHELKRVSVQLETMINDSHPEVRIAATQSLGRFESSFSLLREILLQTTTTSDNFGVIKVALHEIAQTNYQPHVISTLNAVLSRPAFPFPCLAQKLLGRFNM